MAKKKLNWKKIKKAGAIALSFVTMLSTLSFGGAINGSDKAEAASQGYTVDINLYDYDKTTLKDPDETLYSKNNNGPFYVVAVAKGGKNGEVWTTYAVKKVEKLEKKTTTVNFSASDFRIDVYNGDQFERNDYNFPQGSWWPQGHYDPSNTYNMDSVTLYRIKDGLAEYQVKTGSLWGENISYEDLIAQFERDDSAPEGYKYITPDINNNKGTIKLYKSDYKAQYELRIDFDAAGDKIEPKDHYYALVELPHQSGSTWFVADLTGDGKQGTKSIKVNEWLDQNGQRAHDQHFTGNENAGIYPCM